MILSELSGSSVVQVGLGPAGWSVTVPLGSGRPQATFGGMELV